jgi:hypothetical protein
MKVKIKVEREVEVKSILIRVQPRYIGTSVDDDIAPDAPKLIGVVWEAEVDIDTGIVQNWPAGAELDFHAKVCDAGSYYLKDAFGEVVASIQNDYVPNDIVPGEYGDYIDMKIDKDGMVTNWPKSPCVDKFFAEKD